MGLACPPSEPPRMHQPPPPQAPCHAAATNAAVCRRFFATAPSLHGKPPMHALQPCPSATHASANATTTNPDANAASSWPLWQCGIANRRVLLLHPWCPAANETRCSSLWIPLIQLAIKLPVNTPSPRLKIFLRDDHQNVHTLMNRINHNACTMRVPIKTPIPPQSDWNPTMHGMQGF